jgi:poly(3-hydroxybutyrate) depolymerase
MPSTMRSRSWLSRVVAGLLLVVAISGAAPAQSLRRLPALGLRADAVTVSGLSSGAYMAGQFEVAYSASVSGAAILAGGPYGCSRGSVATAALKCSCPADKSFELTLAGAFGFGCYVQSDAVYVSFAQSALNRNRNAIDDTANIARHRIWLFSGGKDPIVDPALVAATKSFYSSLGVPPGRLQLEHRSDAGHGFPSPAAPLPCSVTAQPFLIDCGSFDAAEALLRWLYPDLPAIPGAVDAGAFRKFSQTPYLSTGFTGLDASGWLYVPAACEHTGAHCRLHVAFHGCEQGQSFRTAAGHTYGRQFVDGTGYNGWAEAGGIVVLYPQVRATTEGTPYSAYRYNPKGCWDFWGYSTDAADAAPLRFGQRDAPQMKAVKAMIDDLLRSPQ